jgi:hypothetical protein
MCIILDIRTDIALEFEGVVKMSQDNLDYDAFLAHLNAYGASSDS